MLLLRRRRKHQFQLFDNVFFNTFDKTTLQKQTSSQEQTICDVCSSKQNIPLLKKFQTVYDTIDKLEEENNNENNEIMNMNITDMIQYMSESTNTAFNGK